jgi:hypothetical protein
MIDENEVATDRKAVCEEDALRNDVRTAMKQIEEGRVVSNSEAKAELLKRFAH